MFEGRLYPFQEGAVERMIERKSLLVAYEMGLGKTVITIAALERLFEDGECSAGLVITPASLKYQWKREIKKFTDAAPVLVIDGDPDERHRQYSKAKTGRYDYIILNYEQVLNDWADVVKLPRDFVVCDEVTAIKSFKAKRARRIKKLAAPYRFGLTGQPIENRAEELYSIMQFVDPDVLGRWDIFDRLFVVRNPWGGVKYYKNLKMLHEKVAEAMVRCTRHAVADELPKVADETVPVRFDKAGARLYNFITDDLLEELYGAMGAFGKKFDLWDHYHGADGGAGVQAKVMSRLTCLRMFCDHPDLLTISADKFEESIEEGVFKGGSLYAAQLADRGLLDAPFRQPKMDSTVELIKEILNADKRNKIVLFSSFKPTLYFLADQIQPVRSVFFTGDMTAKAKDRAKMAFAENPRIRVFLSSDAGGYGVDLPQANYLINYDLPWSGGKIDQRNARIVRLSSDWESVTVINMLMDGSIEIRQYDMLDQKRRIASAIVDGKGIDRTGRLKLELETLTRFLEESTV